VKKRRQLVLAHSLAASVRPTNGPWTLYGYVKNVNKVTAPTSMSISSPVLSTRIRGHREVQKEIHYFHFSPLSGISSGRSACSPWLVTNLEYGA